MAPWAKAELRKKRRAERRDRFFGHVRGIFVLLMIATVWVIILNHQVEIQCLNSAKMIQEIKKSATAERLQMEALRHEKEVNQTTQ